MMNSQYHANAKHFMAGDRHCCHSLCLGFVILCVCVLASSPLQAETQPLRLANLQGFVLNQTVSPRAQEFVRRFEHQWRTMRVSSLVNLQIVEKPSARWGTQVSIVLADQVVYRTGIHPRTRDWDQLVSSATQRVTIQARQRVQNPDGFHDPDLAPDEF